MNLKLIKSNSSNLYDATIPKFELKLFVTNSNPESESLISIINNEDILIGALNTSDNRTNNQIGSKSFKSK